MSRDLAPDPLLVDLLDRRARLIRFVIAVAIGMALTALAMDGMRAVAGPPNSDPLSTGSVGLVAIGCFTALSTLALAALTSLARWRSRVSAS